VAVPGFAYWGLTGEGGTTQNGHHWNYYWRRSSLFNGRDAGPGEVGAAEDAQMTLEDYSSRVYNLFFAPPAGVSGLLLMPASPAFASAWRM
jgi:hypothetical protein